MLRVLLALIPGLVVSTWFLGFQFLYVVTSATLSALCGEVICRRSFSDLKDGSAIVTGLLTGLCLPPATPLWIAALGGFVGITLGKHVFGGLGRNLFNPAMVGYAFVLVSFPEQLTHYDAITGATALEIVAHRGGQTLADIATNPAFGFIGSRQYEFINVAHMVGGVILVSTRVIGWRLPLATLLGLALPFILFYDGGSSSSWGSPLFHLLAGGTMLTAFFIATDPVTSPSIPLQQWCYGLFVGSMTALIRTFGTWPDGFAFAILLANILLPLIEDLNMWRREEQH